MLFALDDWLSLESYWIVVDGRVAGCAAFIHDVEFGEDLLGDGQNVDQRGRCTFRARDCGRNIGAEEWEVE